MNRLSARILLGLGAAWAWGWAACAGADPGPFEAPVSVPTSDHPIDRVLRADWASAGIRPAGRCSDGVFVRRVYLDLLGTLPTGYEAKEFLADRNPQKRGVLVDRLLARAEFADYWANKWSDLLRVKAEFPINLWPNAAQAYYRWIHTALQANLPYDRFARELLTASGSNFRVGPVNFYRAVQSRDSQALARAVALTFLGTRAERWPTQQLAGFSVFFSSVAYKATAEWKEEIVFFDPALIPADPADPRRVAWLPDGTRARLQPDQDPRVAFADWLLDPKNPWFARNLANRVWAWVFGRGLVHEPDDLRPDNPPSHPELLALLERQARDARYDVKSLFRLILTSEAYQQSCLPGSAGGTNAAQFAAYPLRRLEAEVLIDALCLITGSTEKYSSAIPEPYTFMPADQRAIALPDGSITSPFLELFGRSPRDTGLESERNLRVTAAQRLHLLNSTHVQRKLDQCRMIQVLTRTHSQPREVARGIYLNVLSRYPTEAELRAATRYAEEQGDARAAAVDLTWALLNSSEFLFRH